MIIFTRYTHILKHWLTKAAAGIIWNPYLISKDMGYNFNQDTNYIVLNLFSCYAIFVTAEKSRINRLRRRKEDEE